MRVANLIFFGWNILMFVWLALTLIGLSQTFGHLNSVATSTELDAAAHGAEFLVGVILLIWMFGALISGMFALKTRSDKTVHHSE